MVFIGIDVSKKKLDVVVLLEPDTLNKRQKQVPNTPEGFQTPITWCQNQTGAAPEELHAVMEATGPYHEALAHALHDAGLVVSVINPNALKDVAKGLGIKAKNDAMDALTIARFGVLTQPRPWQPEPPEVRQLSALLKRLAAVETDLQRERNRLEKARLSQPSAASVIASLARGIAFLEAEQQRLRQTLDDHIDRHPQLKADRQRLQSILVSARCCRGGWSPSCSPANALPRPRSLPLISASSPPCMSPAPASVTVPICPSSARHGCAPNSIWPPSLLAAVIPMCAPSMSGCANAVNVKWQPSALPCANWLIVASASSKTKLISNLRPLRRFDFQDGIYRAGELVEESLCAYS